VPACRHAAPGRRRGSSKRSSRGGRSNSTNVPACRCPMCAVSVGAMLRRRAHIKLGWDVGGGFVGQQKFIFASGIIFKVLIFFCTTIRWCDRKIISRNLLIVFLRIK
jgi:hypothetical protein